MGKNRAAVEQVAQLCRPARSQSIALGRQLEYLTLAWNSLEAAVAIVAGLFAGSIALVGFGFDSVIECASGAALLWRLGKGEKLADIMSGTKTVAEGVKTAKAARDLAGKYNVEMPIVDEVYQILYEDKDPKRAVKDLMARELKEE